MTTTIACFPNGEILQGYSYDRKDKRRDKRRDIILRRDELGNAEIEFLAVHPEFKLTHTWQRRDQLFENHNGEIWRLLNITFCGYHFQHVVDGVLGDRFWVNGGIEAAIASGSLKVLGSSTVQILENSKKRVKKGHSISRPMARNIRNACFLLERTAKKSNLSFLTLTLPPLPDADYLRVLANWGKCVNLLLKWLDYRCLINKIDFQYVYCTEIQEKRFAVTGQLPLHIHVVFQGRKTSRSPWVVGYLAVRRAWARIIGEYIDGEFETRALENIQVVRKSASRYLGKYISKGVASSNNVNILSELQRTGLCIHWAGMCRRLSRHIKSATIRISSSSSSSQVVYEFIERRDEILSLGLMLYWSSYDIILDSHNSIKIGCGVLSKSTLDGGFADIVEYLYSVMDTEYE